MASPIGLEKIKNARTFSVATVLLVGVFIVYPILTLFPYYFVYTSPLFISSVNANSIIAQKPFGVGIHDLRSALTTRYGPDVKLGFIDTKPMKAIFPNSQVQDIRVTGTNDYDVLILGVNEDFPENITNADAKFEKDFSFYINGLEYWRAYVKQE